MINTCKERPKQLLESGGCLTATGEKAKATANNESECGLVSLASLVKNK